MKLRRLGCLAALILTGCVLDFGSLTRVSPLQETVLHGDSGPKFVMIEIEGVISDFRRRSPFGVVQPSMVAHTREVLDRAADDDNVAGLLLRIQSPGGTVAASETLHYEIVTWAIENEKPVIAFMQGLATSGGYYVAMAADEVIAHPTTVTGSIGVVMHGVNVSGLMKRFGVEDQTLTSGDFKDSGSPLRPMRKEERTQLQSVIDDLQSRFIEVVAEGRPALEPDRVEALSDGRVYTAQQALDSGLIDGIGHFDHAIERAEKMAKLEESRVVIYHRSSEYRDNIYSRSPQIPVQNVDIDLLSLPGQELPVGFYYMWPRALP